MKVLVALRARLPTPFLVRPPVPERTPVRVMARAVVPRRVEMVRAGAGRAAVQAAARPVVAQAADAAADAADAAAEENRRGRNECR